MVAMHHTFDYFITPHPSTRTPRNWPLREEGIKSPGLKSAKAGAAKMPITILTSSLSNVLVVLIGVGTSGALVSLDEDAGPPF